MGLGYAVDAMLHRYEWVCHWRCQVPELPLRVAKVDGGLHLAGCQWDAIACIDAVAKQSVAQSGVAWKSLAI
jgi:hypothetical protein